MKIKNEFKSTVSSIYTYAAEEKYDDILTSQLARKEVVDELLRIKYKYGQIKSYTIEQVMGEFGGAAYAIIQVHRERYITEEHMANAGSDKVMIVGVMSSVSCDNIAPDK